MSNAVNIVWKFTATGMSAAVQRVQGGWTWSQQAIVTANSGNCNGTFVLQGTNDPAGAVGWTDIATLTVASAASPNALASQGTHAWTRYRVNCTALVGTGVAATVAITA